MNFIDIKTHGTIKKMVMSVRII